MGKFDGVKETFVFYNDWMHTIDEADMTDAEFRELMRIVVIYNETGMEPRANALGAMGRMQFATIRRQIDKDREKWANTRESRSRAGKASGAARRRKAAQRPAEQADDAVLPGGSQWDVQLEHFERAEQKEHVFTEQRGVRDADKCSCDGNGLGYGFGFGHGIGNGYDSRSRTRFVPDGYGEVSGDGHGADTVRQCGARSYAPQSSISLDEWFDGTLWAMYPRHEGREAARRVLVDMAPDDELRIKIINGLERTLRLNPRFAERDIPHIPFLAKWLSDRRWEDEFEEAGKDDETGQKRGRQRNVGCVATDWDAEIASGRTGVGEFELAWGHDSAASRDV